MSKILWRLLIPLAAALTFSSSSHAGDILGGQLVLVGSATVQGNAFSVGGSTFSVSAGQVVVGPQVYTTTAVVSSVLLNSWMIVASTNPSGATAVTFSGLSPQAWYRLRWSLTDLSPNYAIAALSVNSDTISITTWELYNQEMPILVPPATGGPSTTAIFLTGTFILE